MKETTNDVKSTNLRFDKKGRLVYAKVTTEQGAIISHSINYDENGNVISYMNSEGYSCTCMYNDKDSLKEFKDSNGYSLTREFDENGNLISKINEKGKYTFEYDKKGRCIKEVAPPIGCQSEKPCLHHNSSHNGRITTYKYCGIEKTIVTINDDNDCEKTIDIIHAASQDISNEEEKPVEIHRDYNHTGDIIKETLNYDDEEITTNFEYSENFLKGTTKAISTNYTLTNCYNTNGNRISQKIDGADNSMQLFFIIYDEGCNPLFYIDNSGSIKLYRFDSDNNMIWYKDSNGLEIWNTFTDGLNVIHRSIDKGIRSLVRCEYDAKGRLVKEIEIDNENDVKETIYTFSRDGLSASVYYPDGECETRQMDEAGNITKIFTGRGIEELFEYNFNNDEILHTISLFGTIIYTESTEYNEKGLMIAKDICSYGNHIREEYGYDDDDNEIFYQRFHRHRRH